MNKKAYINGIEVVIKEFRRYYDKESRGYKGKCKCYVPAVDIVDWFNIEMIEIR